MVLDNLAGNDGFASSGEIGREFGFDQIEWAIFDLVVDAPDIEPDGADHHQINSRGEPFTRSKEVQPCTKLAPVIFCTTRTRAHIAVSASDEHAERHDQARGISENEMIPLKASRIIFPAGYFVSPAAPGGFSNKPQPLRPNCGSACFPSWRISSRIRDKPQRRFLSIERPWLRGRWHRMRSGTPCSALLSHCLGNQLSQSLATYDALLVRNPRDINALLGYARVLSWQDRLTASLHEYERVLAFDPRNQEALDGIARVQSWRGRQRDAQRRARKILANNAADAQAAITLANSELSMGRPDQAGRIPR